MLDAAGVVGKIATEPCAVWHGVAGAWEDSGSMRDTS